MGGQCDAIIENIGLVVEDDMSWQGKEACIKGGVGQCDIVALW